MPDVTWRAALLVAGGAVLGALARWLLGALLPRGFPYATLAVNVVGSFLIGALLFHPALAAPHSQAWRLFLAVGFLGAFTTMSSFAFDTIVYAEAGRWGLALVNGVLNPLLSVGAAFGGLLVARAFA